MASSAICGLLIISLQQHMGLKHAFAAYPLRPDGVNMPCCSYTPCDGWGVCVSCPVKCEDGVNRVRYGCNRQCSMILCIIVQDRDFAVVGEFKCNPYPIRRPDRVCYSSGERERNLLHFTRAG